jgi:hypothetical protein
LVGGGNSGRGDIGPVLPVTLPVEVVGHCPDQLPCVHGEACVGRLRDGAEEYRMLGTEPGQRRGQVR